MIPRLIALFAGLVLDTEPWPFDIDEFLPKQRSRTYRQAKRRRRRFGFRR